MIPDILKNWRSLALSCAALAIAGVLFYLWAYDRGYSARDRAVAAASLQSTMRAAAANQFALGMEMNAAAARAAQAATLNASIEASHESDDDLPAPAIMQRTFDRLRALDGEID